VAVRAAAACSARQPWGRRLVRARRWARSGSCASRSRVAR
jgi:hypothetical protein